MLSPAMSDIHDSPDTLPGNAKRNTAIATEKNLLKDRSDLVPIWIRSPKNGAEPYTGLTRSYLYQLAGQGVIRTVSIREPGKERGCRLFHLQSILDFIARQEVPAGGRAMREEALG